MFSSVKKLSLVTLSFASLLASTPSWAAQDQALIQETRKNQASHQAGQEQAVAKPALDHGPRAQVTPWVNRQRQAAHDAAQHDPKNDAGQSKSGAQ